MNQRYFGGKKRDSRPHSTTTTTSFNENRSGENELSNVRSFIILGSGQGFNSFNKDNKAYFID